MDETLRTCPRNVLNKNPLFYLNLFHAVKATRDSAVTQGKQDAVALLDQLESTLYEYTNVLPAELPSYILSDNNLRDIYLADEKGVSYNTEKWYQFQKSITEKLDTLTQDQALTFLNWCIQMLNMNFARHKKKCSNPAICHTDQGYERRLQYLSRLIEEATPIAIAPAFFSEARPKPMSKIQWLGTQKELAELFIQLKAKGWIVSFEPETLKECFTNANSIQQYLKPGEFTADLGGTFEQVFTPEYSPKFHGIYTNPKSDSND